MMQGFISGHARGFGHRRLIGLDIGSHALKLVQLAWRGDTATLEAAATAPLPPGAVAQRQIADVERVGHAIAALVARAAPRTRQAATAIADARIMTRRLRLPAAMPMDERRARLHTAAQQLLPDEADDMSLDHLPLGSAQDALDELLLVACRRQQVDSLAAALAIGGLEPVAVDIESHALRRACRFLDHQLPGDAQPTLLVDIGAAGLRAGVLHGGDMPSLHEQAFDAGGGQHAATLAPTLAGALERIIQLDAARDTAPRPEQLLLSGGGAGLPGLAAALAARLQMPVRVAAPRLTDAGPAVDASQLIALGLASRSAGR